MSLRLEMLQVARLAPKLLGESASLVKDFIFSQQHASGGFKDRDGNPDLYYTVFALDTLLALRETGPTEPLRDYLRSFGSGEALDFVHRCCLCRAWASLGTWGVPTLEPSARAEIARQLAAYRARDGGFHIDPGSATGTAYATFLAVGALQDLGIALAEPERMFDSLASLKTPDGAWSNERGIPIGATNATAAAIGVLRQLGHASVPASASAWLLDQCHPMGGFRAIPGAPIPDLLSTATALHALAAIEAPLDSIRESCLDFVDSLWTNAGGFHGHWHEDHLDCEYTYYGLLALGHLSV